MFYRNKEMFYRNKENVNVQIRTPFAYSFHRQKISKKYKVLKDNCRLTNILV